jgi:hypothetical protein
MPKILLVLYTLTGRRGNKETGQGFESFITGGPWVWGGGGVGDGRAKTHGKKCIEFRRLKNRE